MNSLRQDKSVAYISSIQLNPKTLNPIPILPRYDTNEPLAASSLMFSDKESKRLITVSANGEFSLPPDKIKLVLTIRSLKPNIDEAKHSVFRRLDYVQQTLKNNSVRDSDVHISKTFNRKDAVYEVLVEVVVYFADFQKYQKLQNYFVEKLDENVKILQPELLHTSLRLENLKRQASIQALRNAKHIASDLAKTVGLSLGKPLTIIEESSKEIEGMQSYERQHDPSALKTFQELVNEKTVTVTVHISVTFELKTKSKIQRQNVC
jgi:uncharacterized protein YggE